jgi:hypothetical protein
MRQDFVPTCCDAPTEVKVDMKMTVFCDYVLFNMFCLNEITY